MEIRTSACERPTHTHTYVQEADRQQIERLMPTLLSFSRSCNACNLLEHLNCNFESVGCVNHADSEYAQVAAMPNAELFALKVFHEMTGILLRQLRMLPSQLLAQWPHTHVREKRIALSMIPCLKCSRQSA